MVYTFIVFFLTTLAMFAISDYVLYVQYTRHTQSWEAEGRPYGYFFIPNELKPLGVFRFGSWIATQTRSLSLLGATPEWARDEKRVVVLLRVFRSLMLVLVGSWVMFAYFSIAKGK